MAQGKFPDSMKVAEIVPLYKGKDRELCTNYRPISLLITISKILEKIVYNRSYSFLNSTGQIFESQYGFQSKHSCEHAVQELLGNFLKGRELGKSTLAVFLDLSKAFDTISHSVLYMKLERYGICGTCFSWFRSYLENRQKRVKCATADGLEYSDLKPVNFGTSQGLVLGPLIFLIFNNDLHIHIMYSNCILFAKDTMLYSTHRDLRHLTWCIREDLMTLTDWFRANKLTLNLNKSVCMLFDKQNRNKFQRSLCLQDLGLPIADHTKFLGVLLDDSLNWHYHYSHVMLKLKHNSNMLKKGKNLLSTQAKCCLYFGHIYSHLSYCVSTWGPMLQQSQIKQLQQFQNKCINMIDATATRLSDKFRKLKILPVKEIIQLELAKIGYCMLKDDLPIKILSCITTDSCSKILKKKHMYNTRQKELINLPKVLDSKYYSSFLVQSVKVVQPLLGITGKSPTIHSFANKFKSRYFATGNNKS